jgi:hypothetical protein
MKSLNLLTMIVAVLSVAGCATDRGAKTNTGKERASDIAKARAVIFAIQPELKKLIAYTPDELKTQKRKEAQEYYQSDVVHRLDNISAYIKSSAMHWVHVDWEEPPELVFWTEGLAPTAWGAKEYLFVIKVPKTGKPTILNAYHLDDPAPTCRVEEYEYVRFTTHPTKGWGCNYHIAAVFSYMQVGGSGSAFANFEIGWNRYRDIVYIVRFITSFPVAVDTNPPQEL